MREESVIAEVDRLPEDMHSHDRDDQAAPGEEPGRHRGERQQVHQSDGDRGGPHDLAALHGVRHRQACVGRDHDVTGSG
ncbi:MAG: hypothetical protein ACK55I_15650, partial [bacterium]